MEAIVVGVPEIEARGSVPGKQVSGNGGGGGGGGGSVVGGGGEDRVVGKWDPLNFFFGSWRAGWVRRDSHPRRGLS